MRPFDLIVIGGGAGGMAAVDAALRRDARVLLVQDGPMGGDCTWTGCVPSKALIAAAAQGTGPDEAMATARRAVLQVAGAETPEVFRRRGAEVAIGRARFLTARTVEVDGARHEGGRFVIATGARPLLPPIEGLDAARPLTSETLWDLERLPSSIAVLGGGPIGVELGQALARLGVAVTLVEADARVLGREEPETATLIAAALRADGVTLHLGARVERVERAADGRVSVHAGGSAAVVDEVLVAFGRVPVTQGLDLVHAGVQVDGDGNIETDDRMATTAPGIYAVGDVTGRFPFTHGAYAMGLVAVANALGPVGWRRFSARAIPSVTYTDPEVARVGMVEAEAYERWGERAVVVELPMRAVDRAVAEDRTEGHVKLVAAPGRVLGRRAGGQIVGVTVASPHAGELIHELSLAMLLRIPPGALALATHAYPTWGMAVQQAVSGFFVDLEEGTRRPACPPVRS